MDLGHLRGGDDALAGGARLAIGDVFRQRALEKHGLLEHHAELAAQALHRDLADIRAVNGDPAGLHIPVPHQEQGQRGFAAARLPDQRHGFAGRHLQAELPVQRLVRRVTEIHILEPHGARPARQRRRAGRGHDIHRLVEHLHHAPHGDKRLIHLRKHRGQPEDGIDGPPNVGVEGVEIAVGHLAAEHIKRTQRDDRDRAHGRHALRHHAEPGGAHAAQEELVQPARGLAEKALAFLVILVVDAHMPHPGQGLLEPAGYLVIDVAVHLVGVADAVGKEAVGHGIEDQRAGDDQRQLPGQGEEDRNRKKEHHDVHHQLDRVAGHQALHHVDVVHEPADQHARRMVAMGAQAQVQDLAVHRQPDVGDEPPRGEHDEVVVDVTHAGGDHRHQEDRRQRERQQAQ